MLSTGQPWRGNSILGRVSYHTTFTNDQLSRGQIVLGPVAGLPIAYLLSHSKHERVTNKSRVVHERVSVRPLSKAGSKNFC